MPDGQRPRVLLILHELSLSGAPKLILDLFEHLQNDVELRCVSISGGPLADRCRALGKLDILPRMPMGGPMAKRIGPKIERAFTSGLRLLLKSLSEDLKKWDPDLIYFNSVWAAPVTNVLSVPDAPTLMHVHELDIGIALAVQRYSDAILKRPDGYIAVADAVKNVMVGSYDMPAGKIVTIHGAVPDSYAEYVESFSTAKVAGNRPFIVGGCGTPYWRKGVFLFLQTAKEVTKRLGPNAVQFQWIGAAGEEEMVMCVQSARKLGVESVVTFVPTTPEPLKWFNNFDLFAMTSIEDPCPIVVLENMILGTPVICFKDGGGSVEEIGDTGGIVEDFSVCSMADQIVALMNDRPRLKALGERSAARVKSQFVVSVQAPKILSAIHRLKRNKENGT